VGLIVLVLLLALLLGGLGFAAHIFWLFAVVAAVLWIAGFAFRSYGEPPAEWTETARADRLANEALDRPAERGEGPPPSWAPPTGRATRFTLVRHGSTEHSLAQRLSVDAETSAHGHHVVGELQSERHIFRRSRTRVKCDCPHDDARAGRYVIFRVNRHRRAVVFEIGLRAHL